MVRFTLAALVLIASLLSCDLLDLSGVMLESDGAITADEAVAGLKEALAVGADSASSRLGDTGGYLLREAVRIALPENARAVFAFADTLDAIMGAWGPVLTAAAAEVLAADMSVFEADDSLMIAMNRAAESAAALAAPIFKNAITGMTVQDGFDILYGDSTAATGYLRDNTFAELVEAYAPVIDSALARTGAYDLWQSIAISYNELAMNYHALTSLTTQDMPALPFDRLVVDMGAYATGEALDGLFLMVGREESRIRRDPVARVTEILRKVFGSLESNEAA
jgi:hypothetical protein